MPYLNSAIKEFQYYKSLGDHCINRLSEEELNWKANEESNSINIIINHLNGNMMSRWTDFLNSDGEKDSRNRDQEFEELIKTKAQAKVKWEEGWACLFKALESVNAQKLEDIVYIRNIGHTITEAINRQLCHYSYHIGQMVYLSKMIKSSQWGSLSIPKGNSQSYNKKKFSVDKHRGHFTDGFLKQ